MKKKKIVIIGNWKMNNDFLETKKYIKKFLNLYESNLYKIDSNIKFGLAVPTTSIKFLKENTNKLQMYIASQNISEFSHGSYTGEQSAQMIKSVGANSTILGHSERRKYFNETNQIINAKLHEALKKNLSVILCVGETFEERKNKTWKKVINAQIKECLKKVTLNRLNKIIIAYEPVWAIGTGLSATSLEAEEGCKYIRQRLKVIFDEKNSKKIIIQYGGSVNHDNISELMKQPNINGALVGKASLDPNIFIKLLSFNNEL